MVALMDVRAMQPGDRRFVVPTWAHQSSYEGRSLSERFAIVDRIIDGGARVVVLGGPNGAVHVWAAGSSDGALHFVYVPPELRGQRLARRAIVALLGEYPDTIDVTHRWPRELRRFRFDPYALLCARKAA